MLATQEQGRSAETRHPIATVVYTYCDDWPNSRRYPDKPDIFGRVQALATAELLKTGRTDTAFLGSKNVQADGQIVSDVIAKQIRRDLRLADYSNPLILSWPQAETTRGETVEFKRFAQDHNWQNLQALTIKPHEKRVRRAIQRKFGGKASQIPVLIAEDVIAERHPKLVWDLQSDPMYQGMTRRENVLNLIDSIPVVGGVFLDAAQLVLRNKKLEALAVRLLSKSRPTAK